MTLRAGAPARRILIATAILALAAAGAGYAALSKGNGRTVSVTRTVAQVPTAPVTRSRHADADADGAENARRSDDRQTAAAAGQRHTAENTLDRNDAETDGDATPASTTPASTTPAGSGGTGETQAQPILLDTNAASTYNPYAYPASNFGDPSLAIDGETADRLDGAGRPRRRAEDGRGSR